MSTKSKPSKPKVAESALESKLSEAIERFSANNVAEALSIFETIAKEAIETGNVGLARVANSYIANKKHKEVKPVESDPVQEAVFLLNAKQPETALEKIEKILETQDSNANIHYLKAIALANTQQTEQSAESLKKAVELEPTLLFVYRLEPDFKACRNSPSFVEFELD